ncbi:SKP1-like protein 14 [Dioscorea cayenensis subsp. rotundata]|uniref:SKP1-like protein n=1 Tax=Dioscorea cayennensis subsp. rotundata TaxID=55577 RepID=A0AB40ARH1_DIOCR|nr:SKP1-like protein 14 [Dioscorea cayenensis subsp. rotundata]
MATIITKEQQEKEKMVTLVSSDSEKFVVEQKVAEKSHVIKMVMNCCGIESPIPVRRVKGDILKSILEYCEKHSKGEAQEVMEKWDKEYMDKAEKDLVFFHDLMLASHFLHIQELVDLIAVTFAGMLKMKSPEEIRQKFNINNDLTKEQEEHIMTTFGWAFQPI